MRKQTILVMALGILFSGEVARTLGAESCEPIRTFADGKVPLREIFVSSGGEGAGEETREKPYRTVGEALRNVRAGDAIRLQPGEYEGGIFARGLQGTEAAPIWIGGETGKARPVIKGGSNGIQISSARFVVIENLEIQGATGNGINCDDGGEYGNANATRGMVFRNLFIHEIGTGKNNDGLKLSGVNDYFVLDCKFERVSVNGSGIDHVGCHDGLIARCEFREMGNSIQCKGGSENIEIRWNRFVNGGGRAVNIGGSTGFAFFRPPLSKSEPNHEARRIRVEANLFQGSDAPVAFVGAVDCLVANNTMVEPKRWVVRILQETNSKDGYEFLKCGKNQFVNNLVVFKAGQISTHLNIGGNTEPGSFEFANNLWFASDRPDRSKPSLSTPEAQGIYGVDPGFRDAGGEDYALKQMGPAVGKGRKIAGVVADLHERCFADPPSIGAFEAQE